MYLKYTPLSRSHKACLNTQAKERFEQDWSEHTALLRAAGDAEWGCSDSAVENWADHTIMEKANDVDQLPGASHLPKDEPESFPIDRIECFSKVYENGIKVQLLLDAFLLDLPQRIDHVDGASARSKTALCLRQSFI